MAGIFFIPIFLTIIQYPIQVFETVRLLEIRVVSLLVYNALTGFVV